MTTPRAHRRSLLSIAVWACALAVVAVGVLSGNPPTAIDAADSDSGQPDVATDSAKNADESPRVRFARSGDGFLVVEPPRGERPRREEGSSSGSIVGYSVEVEPDLKSRAWAFSELTDQVLRDRERGWEALGMGRFRRVVDVDQADVRVVLARPETVDSHCATVGLFTSGQYSCWDGARAMINLNRWLHGASDFENLQVYRRYVVNHEVGHGLGYGHQSCATAGSLAPVMMQQTKSTGSCKPNEWPQPRREST